MNSFHTIPKDFLVKWQEIADLLAKIIKVPAASIMKTENDYMEVFISSQSKNNPYKRGDNKYWQGLYCETVIKTQQKLLVTNALKDKDWNKNPDIKLGMISYLGLPLNFPDKTPFGTICVLDNKKNSYSEDCEKLLMQFKNIIEIDLAIIQTLKVDKTDKLIDKLVSRNNELELTKETLRKNEKEFQTWIQNSPICTKKLDLDFNLQFMSNAGIKELKVDDIQELYGRPYPFYFLPKDFQTIMKSKLKEIKKTRKRIELALKHSCNDFISKPINKETLNKMIYKYLIHI